MLIMGVNDCSNSDYHADSNFISSSGLKLLLEDREKFYKEKILGLSEPRTEQNHLTEGSLLHSMILEPEKISQEYAFYEGLRKQGSDFESFQSLNTDKLIISKPQRIRVESYFEAYKRLPTAKKILEGCVSEHTICQLLSEVPIKVRCDAINIEKGYIVDVKTSSFEASLESWKLTVEKWSYELSAALYCRAAEQFYGKPFDFYFLVVDKKNLVCEVYKLSKATRSKGDAKVNSALTLYKLCKSSGIWKNNEQPVVETVGDYEILEC